MSETTEDTAARMLTRRIIAFRRAGDAWRRSDEVHTQHLYERDELLAALDDAGFEAPGCGAAAVRPGPYAVAARKR